MPSNSSSRLNTMSGFQSMIARLSSDRLSLRPSGNTSCPAAFRCEMTSYSVRTSSICFSDMPRSDSGGTSVACTSTRARIFFTARPASQRHPRQLALFVGLGQTRDDPAKMRLQFAARAADVQIQGFTALDHQSHHLMYQVFAEGSGAHDLLAQRMAQLAQHGGRFRR